LSLQLAVAWAGEAAGEPTRLGWWKSDLVDPEGGGDLFARLALRTAPWAGLVPRQFLRTFVNILDLLADDPEQDVKNLLERRKKKQSWPAASSTSRRRTTALAAACALRLRGVVPEGAEPCRRVSHVAECS
jgi:hypothetical protein